MLTSIIELPPRRVRKPRERVRCPQAHPYLSVRGIERGAVVLSYCGVRRVAKPRGASELQLFVAITDEHEAPLSQARFYRKFTKHLMAVGFDESCDGKVATFYGRWASPSGETGPWSMPCSTRIVAR